MLVLTRKLLESVVIGDDIEVFILEIKGDRVRLGIKAPRDVPVHRKEVYEEIRRSNIEAASTTGMEGLDRLLEQGLPARGEGRVKGERRPSD